jgi:glycosyltransferase involved in cell wall biosynthesis
MTPAISIIVPTFNRARQVERCVAGLLAQDLEPERYEVVVVDDGSTDDTGEGLRPWLADARLTVVRLAERAGRGPARNAALARARGRYVVFVDSDTYSPPWFVRAHLAAHARSPGSIVDGPAITVAAVNPGVVRARHVRLQAWLDRGGEQFVTVNTSCPRAALDQVGGFDPRFGLRYGWEDVELGDRLRALGLGRVKERRAYVVHERERLSLDEQGRKLEECGANAALYFAKAPSPATVRRIRGRMLRQNRVCIRLGLTENRLVRMAAATSGVAGIVARTVAAPLYRAHRYASGLQRGMAECGLTTIE